MSNEITRAELETLASMVNDKLASIGLAAPHGDYEVTVERVQRWEAVIHHPKEGRKTLLAGTKREIACFLSGLKDGITLASKSVFNRPPQQIVDEYNRLKQAGQVWP